MRVSSEWDFFARKTYEANFGETPAGDISKISSDEIPQHDLILAGFPCQPFSHAGLRKGFDDTRGTLFFDIARIADSRKPKVLLLENVRGFLTHDGGRTFAVVRRVLDEMGYQVFHKVLNARDFGLPQSRPRLFIVAIRRELEITLPFEFPTPPQNEVRLGSILEASVDPKYTISDRLWIGHQRRKRDHLEKGNGFGFNIFHSDSPHTRTLSARYYKDGSEILIHQDGANPRKLTPREAARLQGFPDSFLIPVSDAQAYKEFGNSVPIPVIRAIAQKLAPTLLS